jgi:rieske iron-sulfur protein
MAQECGCGCAPAGLSSRQRRRVIQIAATGVAAPWLMGGVSAHAAIVAGDRLVEEDAEGPPTPLKATDLKVGRPMLAYPFDVKNGVVRNGTRLNKIVLLRVADASMDAKTAARSAGGVVAYSAICTHQGCDVKTWLSKEKALVCFCHASKFQLLEGGTVSSGPANRALPHVPLKLEGDQLVLAGGFSTPPGVSG